MHKIEVDLQIVFRITSTCGCSGANLFIVVMEVHLLPATRDIQLSVVVLGTITYINLT